MRIFKKLLPPVLGLILFAGVNGLLSFLFIPYQYTRVNIHKLETNDYDTLILGSSHGGSAIDPAVLRKLDGRSAYNAAAGGQYPLDNYYLLLDALKGHEVERVIYECDPSYWLHTDPFNRNARYQLGQMAPSWVRLRYFLDAFSGKDIRYVFMPWCFYSTAWPEIRDRVRLKLSPAYANYEIGIFQDSAQVFTEDGFTAIADSSEGSREIPQLAFTEASAASVEKNLAYVERLCRLCRDRGIALTVVTTPLPETTRRENEAFYREAHAMIASLASDCGARFLDYTSPVGTDEMSRLDHDYADEAFSDAEGHMRVSTAQAFTAALAEEL